MSKLINSGGVKIISNIKNLKLSCKVIRNGKIRASLTISDVKRGGGFYFFL